jgi:plastocyanin
MEKKMATTAISLKKNQGVLVPSQPSVPVTSGDTITFATSDGTPAYLFFSPGATAVLSPAPASPVEVSATAASFTFTSSAPGAYSVFFETSADAAVPDFPVLPSGLLLLEIDTTGLGFAGQDNRTKG